MPLTSRPNQARVKSSIRNSGKDGAQKALDSVKLRHEAIVKPWKEDRDKPTFSTKIEEKFGLVLGKVKMVGEKAEKAGITVWQLLEHGTDIRFMKLSHDWVSKTAPGRLSSGSGGGRTLGLNLKEPEGGIEAREFSKSVAEVQKGATDSFIKTGYAEGFRKALGK